MLRNKLSKFITIKKQESEKIFSNAADLVSETVANATERVGGTLSETKEKMAGAVSDAMSLVSEKATDATASVSAVAAKQVEKLPKPKKYFRCPFSKSQTHEVKKIARREARTALAAAKRARADIEKTLAKKEKKSFGWNKLFFAGLGLTAAASLVYLLRELFSPTGGAWVPHTASAPYLNEPLAEEELDELFKEN